MMNVEPDMKFGDIVFCTDPHNFYCGRKVEILSKEFDPQYGVIRVKVVGTNVYFVSRVSNLYKV